MSDTIFNLLLAVFLLAANAFYVAAEFALVKSKGFRIDALAEEDRFGARLTQHMLQERRGLSRLLPARHHHGLARPRLGRRADRRGAPRAAARCRSACRSRPLHFTAFLVGFLVFSSLHIVLGEQVPKTLAIREPEPVSLWIAYPLHVSFLALLSR